MAWRSVSHGVSLKGVFVVEKFVPRLMFSIGRLKGVQVSSIVNEAIKTISSMFILFLWKDFECTKMQIKQKSTKKTKISKQKITQGSNFLRTKTFKKVKIVCFLFWCFLRVQNLFVKKKNKLAWNCLDSLIYYTTILVFYTMKMMEKFFRKFI